METGDSIAFWGFIVIAVIFGITAAWALWDELFEDERNEEKND